MGKPAAGWKIVLYVLVLVLVSGCGSSTPRIAHPIGAAQAELQIEVRIVPSPTNRNTLNVIIEQIAPGTPGASICFDTITQVISLNTPDQPANGDQSTYRVDVQAVSGVDGPLCINQAEQLPNGRIHSAALAIDTESSLYPYDRVQFRHSIVVAQAKPARQITSHVSYHIDVAGRIAEPIHVSEANQRGITGLAVTEIVLVRSLLYRIVAPIILGALFVCALLMMFIHERTTFIQATIALTVGTWNAHQLIVPTSDIHAVVLDQALLCIYALIWISFALFTIRLWRKQKHA
jgi:hypothetical protein